MMAMSANIVLLFSFFVFLLVIYSIKVGNITLYFKKLLLSIKKLTVLPTKQESKALTMTTVNMSESTDNISEIVFPTFPSVSALENKRKPLLRMAMLIFRLLSKSNPVAKWSLIVLLAGIVGLATYVAKHQFLSIELRLLLATSSGLILLITGWFLRHKYLMYALLLQAGGLGIMYIAVYTAYQLYQLLPLSYAFALLFLFSFMGGIIAIVQNIKVLAIFAIAGSFLIPLLLVSDTGNDFGLLSYYALLNMLITTVAKYRAWRSLNVVGLLFTVVLSGHWGLFKYTQDQYLVTQVFLVLFILLYVHITIALADLAKKKQVDWINRLFVCMVPIVGFSFQFYIVKHIAHGVAFSLFFFSLFYAVMVFYLLQRDKNKYYLLIEVYLAFAILCATLFIPLVIHGSWLVVAWALEGGVLLWLFILQNRWWGRIFAVLLQWLSGWLLLAEFPSMANKMPFLNAGFTAGVVIAIVGIISAYGLSRRVKSAVYFEYRLSQLNFIWGVSWWLFAVSKQLYALFPHFIAIPYLFEHSSVRLIETHPQIYNESYYWSSMLICVLITALAAWQAFRKWNWIYTYNVAILLMPAMVVIFFANLPQYATLFLQTPIWLAALVILYWMLYQYEKYPMRFLKLYHGPTFVLLVWQVTLWVSLTIAIGIFRQPGLKHLLYAIVPAIFLFLLQCPSIIQRWPCKRWSQQYLGTGGFLIVLYMMFWLLFTNLQLDKNVLLHPYLPVLNLTDITSIIALVVSLLWIIRKENLDALNWDKNFRDGLLVFLGVISIIWLNAMLLRSLMVYFDLSPRTIFSVHIVQMTMSILWGVMALAMIIIANYLRLRWLWMTAAALVVLVIIKMLLVDFLESYVIERIVFFIAVSVILLIIGFISPLPAANKN